MKQSALILLFVLTLLSAKAQKWQPGFFIDIKNNREEGLININPSGKPPFKDEGFIAFKEDKKATEIKLSASDIRTFKAGNDSFVVAHAPMNESWSKKELDFIRVVLDEPIKLYVLNGSSGGGGRGIGFSPGISVGGGSFGGMGGGVGLSFGGGGGQGGGSAAITWYYGESPAALKQITPQNFVDVMTDIMGDETDIVEKLRSNKYGLRDMEGLVKYFLQLKASHH